jgi:GT2 family glycosyltransferase
MAGFPRVYISVLNWNGYNKTIRCLKSLEKLDYPNYRVVVVDNASGDDSVHCIRLASPDTLIICAETNLGYAGGNELALQQALLDQEAELFWILNNDTTVRPDTLSALVGAYHQHGEALYGGVPLTENSEVNDWRIQTNIWELETGNVRYRMRNLNNFPFQSYFPTLVPKEVGSLSGSSLLIPLPIVRKHGFIDKSFFMYSEEVDYSFRLRQHGIRSFLVPQSIIFHVNGGSRQGKPKLKPIIIYYQTRARLVLARRHLGFFAYMTTILRHLLYIVAWFCASFTKGSIALKCAYYMLLGIRDGITNHVGKTFAPENYLKKSHD